MNTEISYAEDDGEAIAALFVGRRIVRAEMGTAEGAPQVRYQNPQGRLVLDDGTVLHLAGNDGGCSCGAGDYPLERLGVTANIITSARVECSPSGDDLPDDGEGAYRIFVVADAVEVNVAEFVGSDGNGYYGTGFGLTVVRPTGPA